MARNLFEGIFLKAEPHKKKNKKKLFNHDKKHKAYSYYSFACELIESGSRTQVNKSNQDFYVNTN